MTLELDHLVLATRDIEAMLSFYTEVLGLAPHRVEEFRAGRVPFPCARVNEGTLIDLLPPAMWRFGDEASAPGHPNLHHFCLACEPSQWESMMERLERAGVEIELGPMILSGARGDGTSVYVRDPDGILVQFDRGGAA